jgi:hypothetical protein
VPVAQDVKAQLRRLVLARSDLEWAAKLFDEAAHERDPVRSWRLWEAGANAYARPFKRASLELGPEWSEFTDDDLSLLHRQLVTLRDKVFAHNDRTTHRRVVIVPPGGAAEIKRDMFAKQRKVVGPKKLIHAQLGRVEKKIAELAAALCLGQGWVDGEPIELADIDDKLELKKAPSPFQAPARALES